MFDLLYAGIDVAFGIVDIACSTARFAIAAAVVIHEAGQATIQAGRDARVVFDNWVDTLEANAHGCTAITVARSAIDTVAITVFPNSYALAPVAIAGYLPAYEEEAVAVDCEVVRPTPRTDALKALLAAEHHNFCELVATTAQLVATQEANLNAQYAAMNIRELKAAAKAAKVKGYSRMTKDQLVAALTA
ncbi:Rho termination factor N-terminal domain-containing protein [Synechococcus sp. PCC 6312]|uniref:Rho termination factor N-terminal domain-containing protein n=1 Tax=Synechococcus sp. (strain ATCC 27167 / PCC 6312) TaxID=195253 RepID=UPI00029F2FF5|nr:Rho termination factor N-terminal domain-containing protein [Synechococcus sp. PCC 6312]AFY60353.1 Rho termination factor [Synechococcus sp. PCC 6312]